MERSKPVYPKIYNDLNKFPSIKDYYEHIREKLDHMPADEHRWLIVQRNRLCQLDGMGHATALELLACLGKFFVEVDFRSVKDISDADWQRFRLRHDLIPPETKG